MPNLGCAVRPQPAGGAHDCIRCVGLRPPISLDDWAPTVKTHLRRPSSSRSPLRVRQTALLILDMMKAKLRGARPRCVATVPQRLSDSTTRRAPPGAMVWYSLVGSDGKATPART